MKVGPSNSPSSSGHAAGRAPGDAAHAQPADYVAAPAPSSSAKSSATPTPSSSSSLPAGVPSYLAKDMDKSCAQLAKIGAQPQAKNKAVVVCDTDGKAKYVMGKPLFPGTEVKSASAQYNTDPTSGQAGWFIIVSLKSHGQSVWSDYTSKHNVNVSPGDLANQVGFVLDGRLLSWWRPRPPRDSC